MTAASEADSEDFLLPKFKYEGVVDSKFGLALLKICGDYAAAVTSSGTKIELWFMGAQERKGTSFAQIQLDTVATAIYLDDQWLIVGHKDGNLTLFNRVTGKKTVCEFSNAEPDDAGSAGESESEDTSSRNPCILWIDRHGDYIFFASNEGFDVMRADTKVKVTRESFPRRHKLEQAFMNHESLTLYAIVSPNFGDDKAADVLVWKPNFSSLDRRPSTESYKTYARITDGDISIPRDRLLRKDMSQWTPIEVASLFSKSSVSGQRMMLWEADVTGAQLVSMDEHQLTDIGIYEASVRRQILLEIKFAIRDQNSSNSPANSRSTSISGDSVDDASDPITIRSGSPLKLRLSSESPRSESMASSPGKADSKLPKAKVIFTVDGTNDIVSIKVPGPSCSLKQFRTALEAALLEDGLLVRAGGKFTMWRRKGSSARTPILNQKQLDDFMSAELSRQQLAYLEVSIEEEKATDFTSNRRVPLVSVIGKAGSHSDLFMPTVGALLGSRDLESPRTKHSL